MLFAEQIVGGKYRLLRSIGEGGMASVWAARHEVLERDVALKLAPSFGDPVQTQRFLREARIIGRFEHANIVNVVDGGELAEEGYLFLAMELLRGQPFSARIQPGKPLAMSEALPILIGVCRGLEVAHAAGVVHRDVKPENVFLAQVTGGMVPKLVDFGISLAQGSGGSRITIDGQILGTPAYMAPEQAIGKNTVEIGPAADLWAVGVMLYETISGRQPFMASNYHALLRQILDDAPAPLPKETPGLLVTMVARCLEKDPARRFPSATALREALEAALAELGERASHPVQGATNERPKIRTMPSQDLHLDDVTPPAVAHAPTQSAGRGFRSARARLAALGVVACAMVAIGAARSPSGAATHAARFAIDAAAMGQAATAFAALDATKTLPEAPAMLPVGHPSSTGTTAASNERGAHPKARGTTRITSPGF